MNKILGIDLGTTNSCMSVMEGGKAVVLENSEGARTTPSIVAFTKSGERVVGEAAKRQGVTNPTNTIFSVKRFMGRKYDEVREEEHRVPYRVVKAANGDAHISVTVGCKMKTYSPPEISAMILAKLKCDAEAKLGETITQAIITVPAYFNNSQRTATRDAGKMAGLEVLRIISDPVAAALAYGSSRNTKDGMIAFYDLGGGNFSTAVIECGDGIFEVKATNGDTHLGGDDWDSLLMDWIINDFRSDSGIDLTGRADALFRIKVEAENAKIALSSSLKCDIRMPFITSDASGSNSIEKTLARLTMERLTSHPLERSLTSILDCFNDAGISADKIHEVVIAGGMTRMPGITMAVERLTGKVPYQGINPDEAVAIGAAIQGGVFMGEVKDVLTLEVTPLTLAIETAGGVATAMIPRNTTVPTRRSAIFSTDRDNQTSFEVKVLEGERPLARDNVHLGTLQLDGILPAPRGAPQIEVTFDIDANGITHVGAKDLGSGREQKLSIAGFSNT